MKNQFTIGNKTISENHPCFIIAEAGVNHNGEIEKGLELVKIAKDCGADAVKFQLFNAHEQVSKHAFNAPYQRKGSGKKTMLEMADSYDFAWENHKTLLDYANPSYYYLTRIQIGLDWSSIGAGETLSYTIQVDGQNLFTDKYVITEFNQGLQPKQLEFVIPPNSHVIIACTQSANNGAISCILTGFRL